MERDVILWARISADGFLADETGSLRALKGHGMEDWEGQVKEQLKEQADTVILGRGFYDDLVQASVPWPFEGMECYVATEEFLEDTERVTFWPVSYTHLWRRFPPERQEVSSFPMWRPRAQEETGLLDLC